MVIETKDFTGKGLGPEGTKPNARRAMTALNAWLASLHKPEVIHIETIESNAGLFGHRREFQCLRVCVQSANK